MSDTLLNPQIEKYPTRESAAPAAPRRPAGEVLLAFRPARPPPFSVPLCAPVGSAADLGQRPQVSGCCPCGLPSPGLLPPPPRHQPQLRACGWGSTCPPWWKLGSGGLCSSCRLCSSYPTPVSTYPTRPQPPLISISTILNPFHRSPHAHYSSTPRNHLMAVSLL